MPKQKAIKEKGVSAETQQKCALYIRVSTHWQIDKDSLPLQREELINYCKYVLYINSYEVFEDAGFSAKNTERPAYQQMMARLRSGEFSHIVVWKIDRISRNLIDFATMYEEIKRLGVTFVSKNEQFDTSSAMGEAMLKIILVFAELERKVTSERIAAIMLSRASNGQWNGGRTPFGYSYDKESNTFVIDESEASVVRMIYDMYEKERSLLTVAKALNGQGIKSRRGYEWTPVTVQGILRNPFYNGTLRYNYRDESKSRGNAGHDFKTESDWIMIDNHHVPLVDRVQWEKVSDMLTGNRRLVGSGATYNRNNVHIFAGLLRCGNCGSRMAAQANNARANGWRPSIYSCYKRRISNACDNKYVSDITIGPIALNYVANMIKAYNSFGRTTDVATLEKKLLRGDALAEVDHIEGHGLQELYNTFRHEKFPDMPFERDEQTSTAEKETQEMDLLASEKRRNERALTRLQNLFLYGDEVISEKDYLIERKRISDELANIDDRLEVLEKDRSNQFSVADNDFIGNATYFLTAQSLIGKRDIDYAKYIRKIDPHDLKVFLGSIVQNFCIKNGRIESIRFKNGVEHRFLYKDSNE